MTQSISLTEANEFVKKHIGELFSDSALPSIQELGPILQKLDCADQSCDRKIQLGLNAAEANARLDEVLKENKSTALRASLLALLTETPPPITAGEIFREMTFKDYKWHHIATSLTIGGLGASGYWVFARSAVTLGRAIAVGGVGGLIVGGLFSLGLAHMTATRARQESIMPFFRVPKDTNFLSESATYFTKTTEADIAKQILKGGNGTHSEFSTREKSIRVFLNSPWRSGDYVIPQGAALTLRMEEKIQEECREGRQICWPSGARTIAYCEGVKPAPYCFTSLPKIYAIANKPVKMGSAEIAPGKEITLE